MFNKITNIKYDKDQYNIYDYMDSENNKSYIIKGNTQDGNDHILRNALIILDKYVGVKVETDKLIWLHGDGPSPHFILYKDENLKLDSMMVTKFVKSLLPKKSNIDKELICSRLSDVKLTEIKGMVNVIEKKLKKLL